MEFLPLKTVIRSTKLMAVVYSCRYFDISIMLMAPFYTMSLCPPACKNVVSMHFSDKFSLYSFIAASELHAVYI